MGELRFRAMGSDAHVIVVGGPTTLAGDARRRIDDLEARWSRFRDDSEISELNRRAGEFVAVSNDTMELVTRAVEAWRLSGGSFDPTLLGAVIRAGYDRTFETIGAITHAGRSSLRPGASAIDIDADRVRLARGTGFDPGGIGKGLAADIVVHETLAAGAVGVCINVGGDVRVSGSPPDGGDAWTVAIEHEWFETPLALVGLADGAVATSTTLRRRWQTDGQTRHHLIDSGTGRPSESDLNHVTVIAAQAWVAEVFAKAVLLRGSAHPFDLVGGTGAAALAVADDGQVLAMPELDAYLGDLRVGDLAQRVAIGVME
jgi:thiamine biosynthesis lipoprotein